jgi:hypothetical protein
MARPLKENMADKYIVAGIFLIAIIWSLGPGFCKAIRDFEISLAAHEDVNRE